jgi:hypothetical protein
MFTLFLGWHFSLIDYDVCLLSFASILACDASRYVSYTLFLFHIQIEHCLLQDVLFDYIVSNSDRLYISIRFDFVDLLSASLYY